MIKPIVLDLLLLNQNVLTVISSVMAAVSLSKIPTLRELYKATALKAIAPSKARYQPRNEYSDRVSL